MSTAKLLRSSLSPPRRGRTVSWASEIEETIKAEKSASFSPSSRMIPNEALGHSVKIVFETMAQQAELDMKVEDAKMMLSSYCTLESVFSTLASTAMMGYVGFRELRAFMEDCGRSLTSSDFTGIVREVCLRWPWDDLAAAALLDHKRLSLQDLGLLVCSVGTLEYEAVRGARSDGELRSELYMIRQGSRCVSELCPPMRHQVANLLSTIIEANFALETARNRLWLTQQGSRSLTEVFGLISRWQATFSIKDLHHAMAKYGGPEVSQRGLDLIWLRYCARHRGPQLVGLPDFCRQLRPTCLSPEARTF